MISLPNNDDPLPDDEFIYQLRKMGEDYDNAKHLAVKMLTYLKKRAKVEGVEVEFNEDDFIDFILQCNPIFGIHHDGRKMLSDDQEPHPGFFAEQTGILGN